jgi:hypothetical protein
METTMRHLILVATILAATPALADEAADTADMTCLSAYLYHAAQGAPEEAVRSTVGAMFYLGRLEGRSPGVNWVSRIPEYADILTQDDLNAAAPACAAVLRERGAQMVALSALEAARPVP